MTHNITYRLRIQGWSATDYAHLVNSGLGWVSDCEQYWEFECAEDLLKFKRQTKYAQVASSNTR